MFLDIVTDEELFTSQVIKTILLIVLSVGIVYKLYSLYYNWSKAKRTINIATLFILIVILIIAYREYVLEDALLKSPKYVIGTTIGFCSAFARGEGILFEYELLGKKFIVCNTFHPVSIDSIKVPSGKYIVRYSPEFPSFGRMNFKVNVE
jgi:hypothetical protein